MGRLTVSLLNGPNYRPAKIARAKLDRRWLQRIRAAIKQDGSVDTAKAESVVWECAATAFEVALQVLGRDRTALMFYHMASVAATPGQRGRPFGSSHTHTPAQLAILRSSILELDDGSESGRRQAITAVLARELPERREALRKHLRIHLPPLRRKATGEN